MRFMLNLINEEEIIQTLKKISELGWQVVYFSAKGEIKDALKKDIKGGTVNYVEVQGIFS